MDICFSARDYQPGGWQTMAHATFCSLPEGGEKRRLPG